MRMCVLYKRKTKRNTQSHIIVESTESQVYGNINYNNVKQRIAKSSKKSQNPIITTVATADELSNNKTQIMIPAHVIQTNKRK